MKRSGGALAPPDLQSKTGNLPKTGQTREAFTARRTVGPRRLETTRR